jgi:hypothetical protein
MGWNYYKGFEATASPLDLAAWKTREQLRKWAGTIFQTALHIFTAGMVPILAIKYVRYTYKPSKINTLQQAERLGDQYRLLGRSSDNNEWSWKMLLEYQLLNPRT